MNNLRSIHETEIVDILDTINNGIDDIGNAMVKKNNRPLGGTSSIAKAAAGLTLVFPVICSSSIKPSTAQMCTKMVERSAVSMLRMLFAANSLTNASDAYQHIAKFHTNLDFDKIGLDDFLDFADSLDENAIGKPYGAIEDMSMIHRINEDCRRNLNFYLEDDVNESGITSFKIRNIGNSMRVIKEAPDNMPTYDDFTSDYTGKDADGNVTTVKRMDSEGSRSYKAKRAEAEFNANYDQRQKNHDDDLNFKNSEAIRNQRNEEEKFDQNERRMKADADYRAQQQKNYEDDTAYRRGRDKETDAYKAKRDEVSDRLAMMKMDMDNIPKQLLSSDVKKANELVPSLMVINFYTAYDERGKDVRYAQQAVIGIKARMIGVMSSDIITKIITKTNDSRVFLNLVKASTREISFIKDLFLGIDQAKLDALAKKRRGSSNSLFKALERRSLKGKIRKTFGKDNIHRAITSMIVSQEEVELLKKYNDIDIEDPNIVTNFMERMNLLYFIIVDEVSEVAKIMVDDGSKTFEEMTFNAMERETDDKTSKQVLNLMTKMR